MTGQNFRATESKECALCGATFHRDKRNTWKHWGAAKFCSRTCSAQAGANAIKARRLPLAEDFARWHSKGDGCWIWHGGVCKDGYGAFNYDGRSYRANRMALELAGRPVPEGMMACHHCDTPACVNPSHLYVGTPSDNVQDMLRRGRHGKQRSAA